MRIFIAIVLLFVFASPLHATCNKNATLTVTPASVDVDTEQTGQYFQEATVHLVNIDDTGCASRQFCFYPQLVSNTQGSIALLDSHLLIEPVGDWHCVGLLPQDTADFTMTVTQDQSGTTPPHKYNIYARTRSGPSFSYPINDNGMGAFVYNRHDPWGNTCKVP